MENFKQGDFVLLENRAKYNITRLDDGECHLFQIAQIQSGGVQLHGVGQFVPLRELLPFPIDSQEARLIYYDPIIAASMVAEGEDLPIHTTNYAYFMDAFKSVFSYKHVSYFNLVHKAKFKYVHEVQHWLESGHEGFSELKLNDMPLILSNIRK